MLPSFFFEQKRIAKIVLVISILALGATVRIVGIDSNPPGFFCDEASIGVNAASIMTTGRDEHGALLPIFFRAFGEYKFPVFIYGSIPFIGIFGLTEQALRLSAAAFGTLTILLVFFLAGKLFNTRTALVSAFLLAITPWHIHYSRIAFELISFPLLLTLGLFLFFISLKKPKFLPVSASAFAVTCYTYSAAWIIVPLLLGMLVLLYRKWILLNLRLTLVSFILFFALLAPLITHISSGPGQIRAMQVSLFSQDLSTPETISKFFDFYTRYFSLDFLFRFGDNGPITRHYLPGHGQLYWFQLPLLLAGVAFLLWKRNKVSVLLLWLLLIFPLSGALTGESPISSRTILGPVVLALVAGYGATQLANTIKWRRRSLQLGVPLVVFGAVTIVGLWSLAGYLHHYHQTYPNRAAGYWGWQSGPREIVAYFVAVDDQYDDLLMDGDFNAPGIFLSFYAPDGCKKCRIGDLSSHNPNRRQLFAMRPTHLPPKFTYDTKHTIRYPNGEVSFLLVEAHLPLLTADIPQK